MGVTKEQIQITAKDRTSAALRSAEKGVSNFDKKMSLALKSAAAFAGAVGIGAIIKNSLDAADAIGKTAKAAGVGTTFLQEMRFAAEQSGVATNMLDDGMRRLTRRIGLAADGGGPAIKAFEKMNIAVHDVNGNVRNTENIFHDLTSGLGNVKSAAEQAALASAFFGDDAGPKLALLLQEGSTGINTLREKAQELGLVLSEGMIANSEKANDKISQLNQVISMKFTATVVDNAEAIGLLAESMITLVGASAQAFKATYDFSHSLGSSVAKFFHPGITAMDLINDRITKTKEAIEEANGVINDDGFLGFGASTDIEISGAKAKLEELNVTLQKQLEVRRLLSIEKSSPIAKAVPTSPAAKAANANPNNLFAEPTNRDVIDSGAASAKEAARIEASIQAIELQMATEEERLSTSYVNREMIVENAFQDGYIEEERRKSLLLSLEESYNQDMVAIQSDSIDAMAALWESGFNGKLQVAQSVLGQLSNLMQSENKKQFEIGKKAAIADTVINTYQAAMGAYAALARIPYVGPVLGGIAAAAAIVYGKNQVSRIQSQQFGGGSVGGGSAPTGSYSANPNTGAPTGSPAGGSTNVESITGGSAQQSRPQIIQNVTLVGNNFSREQVRELAGKFTEAAGDGVEMNVNFV